MAERERLIELIGSKVCEAYDLNCDEWQPHSCEKCYANDCSIGDLADYLLANGVVVVDMNVVSPKNRPLISQCMGRPLDEIIELVHAKDEGRIIVPRCKVDDTLFYPWVYGGTSGIAILEVDAIKVYVEGRSLVFVKNPESDMPMPSYFFEEDFGKTVFLTREEAEKALAERSKG